MRFAARVVGSLGALVASVLLLVPVADAVVLGKQRVLTVLITYGPQPYSRGVVTETMASADKLLRRASFGKVSLQWTVTPWIDGGDTAPDCTTSTERMIAPLRALASASGFRLDEYDRTIYVVDGVRCGFQGIAQGRDVLLTRQPDMRLVVHELGHTFGLPHEAATNVCSTWCVTQEEGDLYTIMGRGSSDFSVYEKEQLGWVPRQPRATRTGRYTILRANERTVAQQALVVDTDDGQYWLEPRPGAVVPALIVRVVHPEFPSSWPIAPSTLLLAPIRPGHPTVTAGQTFRVAGAFSVTVTKGPAPLRLKLSLAAGY